MAVACPLDPYCLGMCFWTGCSGNADVATSMTHPKSTCNLLLHPPSAANEPHPSTSASRFAFASEEELSKLAEGITPANTAKATAWALNNYQQWMTSRNSLNTGDPVPDDILQCTDPQVINNHLSKYVVETRKSNRRFLPSCGDSSTTVQHSKAYEEQKPSLPKFLGQERLSL